MLSVSDWLPAHRLPVLLFLFAVGCSGAGVEDAGDRAQPVLKGGIDGPPTAVGPFLDGVLPPRTPNSPGSSQWTIVPAFPNLNLASTLVIASNPGDDRVYVGSQDGLVVAFENRADVTTTEAFLDLRDRVAVVWEGGLLGLVFHPAFGDSASPNGKAFYVYYNSHCPLDSSRNAPDLNACDDSYPRTATSGFFNTYLRLSRFEVFDDTVIGDPSTEQVLVNVQLYNSSHRGGGMAFRNDSFLYLAIGDQRRYETAQDIVDTFEGGLFRFAVDVIDNGDGTWTCPTGSHQPRRIFDTLDEISGRYYCIPDDNPWLDPAGGVFEEYCAIGFRNPHRLAHDPITGRIWEGEVGQFQREEVNILECGNNYGWPFREGLIAGVRPEPSSFLGVLTDPVIDFTRAEARSIIGGYVYRGSKFPELYGHYLAGDYVTNQVWAITLDENTMTATKVFLANFGPGNLATWGQDNNGEVFLGDVFSTGPLYTLDRIGVPVPDATALLSETGAFSNMGSAAPSAIWVPYTLNQPFWSDGALKSRFIALPSDGVRDTAAEQIAFSPTGDWLFPTGTVLMKHFELPLDEADPTVTTRLETRFMVLGDDDAWYGLTYRWRANQIEADLLTSEETGDYTIQLSGGGTRAQTWYFPSRLDCLSCHREGSGGALGPRTHQLNGDFTYPSTGRTDNQIRSWNDLAMFSPPVDDASIPSLGKSPALGDVTAPLQDRARSWLDSNCSHCHRPGGANAGFDVRFTTSLADQGLAWTMVRDDLGNPGTVVIYPGDPVLSAAWQRSAAVGPIAMPPLAKALPEQPAVDLLAEWIERLDPGLPRTGLTYEYYEVVGLDFLPDFDALMPVTTGTVSTFDIAIQEREDDFAFRFRGYLLIESAGDYTFYTSSDDGSQLFFDQALLVDNDGRHGNQERSGNVNLAAGYHEIVVTMFDGGGDQALTVSWAGPDTGGSKELIGAGVLFQEAPSVGANNPPALVDPGDQNDRPGDVIALDLIASDDDGDSLYFDVVGLPDGLSLDNETGRISGMLATAGASTITASASDGPDVSVVSFEWLVTGLSCGNGVTDPDEECDDGNIEVGDGCTSSCVLEVCGDGVVNNNGTEACEPPGTALCTDACAVRAPLCGDGFQTPPEQCEDGNVVNGDGCTSSCVSEFCGDGVVNNDGVEACEPPGTGTCTDSCVSRTPLCGDQFLTPPEECEDGNVASGDGCTSSCVLEFCGDGVVNNGGTETCEPPGTTSCTDSCVVRAAQCGDGFLTPPEECEDGNVANGDGCTSGCVAEFCGDGVVNNGGAEACEPPGTDLCTDACAARVAQCGDGFLTPPEQCEDGNVASGDGCTSSCVLEFCGDGVVNNGGTEACEPPGTASCTDSCVVRAAQCGDGFLTPPEECEDGNVASGDGCTSSCVLEFCGDGVVNNGGTEACEPPGTASCTDSCVVRAVQCGDGFLTPPEECEDGNVANGDGCTSGCMLEFCGDGVVNNNGTEACEPPGTALCTDACAVRAAQCGDGLLTPPEQCEDGNLANGDGCTSGCMLEFCGDGVINNNGEACEPPSTALCTDTCAARTAQCGDGFLTPPEQCEDGNISNGDGCSAVCTVEVPAACGDGNVDPGEQCDDGNLINADGCTSTCTLEFCGDGVVNNNGTEACDPPSTALCTDACAARTPQCGDEFLTPPEQCEDGNLINADGCTSSCTLEFCGDGVINNNGAEGCEPPDTEVCTDACTIRTAQCGDGLLTPPEQCEDGNLASGDGCNSGCALEFCGDGVVNNGGTEACDPPGTALCTDACAVRTAQCGDGFQTPPEQCEDGNLANGDGCTSECVAEFCGDGVVNNNDAEGCEPPGTEVCTDACTIRTAQCGDGLLTPPEQCEDGNLASGDGCNSGCALEFCGDGVINNNGTEECEPPDTALCTNGCAAREALCGDGFKTPPEQCEDGNLANGDGCTSSCTLEFCGDGVVNNDGVEACEPPGTALCTTICTIRFPLCGDGLLTSPEECEDGNLANGDGCTSSCVLEFCGDGVINNNDAEACEPPGASACTDACTLRTPLCGDGFVTPPEECEDGNLTDGDGCSSACASEAAPFCGDGVMDDGEECDDGNVEAGDGCSAMCELEPPPTPDGGTPDGGMPDGGIPDGGMPDGGIPDGGDPDGGMDDSGSGSGCSVQKGGAPMDLPVLLSVFALVIARRRRSTAR